MREIIILGWYKYIFLKDGISKELMIQSKYFHISPAMNYFYYYNALTARCGQN